MKFKRNRLFIVLLCLFVCFSGLVYKASDSSGDLCTPNVCTDCHNEYTLLCGSQGVYLRQVDSLTEIHGLSNADAVMLNIHQDTPPDLYPRLVLGGALYCTDCHEDHITLTSNAYQLKNSVNNIPVEVPITRFDSGGCSLPGTVSNSNKTMGWFCRTCHKDDAVLMQNPQYTNRWSDVHHLSGIGCIECHSSHPLEKTMSCECCHYHGSICYPDSYICSTPYDRRTF